MKKKSSHTEPDDTRKEINRLAVMLRERVAAVFESKEFTVENLEFINKRIERIENLSSTEIDIDLILAALKKTQ